MYRKSDIFARGVGLVSGRTQIRKTVDKPDGKCKEFQKGDCLSP